MSQNIKELFELTRHNLEPSLVVKTMERLEKYQQRSARRQIFVFGLIDIISILGLVMTGFYSVRLMISSGFNQYLSLLWSDGAFLSFYWHDLLLSLVESLPVLGLVALLGGLVVFLFSLSKTIINFKLAY